MIENRNRQLDVLRGLAIVLVLGRHLPAEVSSIPWLGAVLPLWRQIGWAGVDLFFVLSGFLVSGLLFREYRKNGGVRVGRFFIRRGLRIYPAFYLMIAVSLVLSPLPLTEYRRVLGEIFFIQNYFDHMWLHTWTLAIEEHFYLFLGLSAALLPRLRKRDPFGALPWIWAAAAVLCLYFRQISPPLAGAEILSPTHKRVDALLFGAVLSYYYWFDREALETAVRKYRWALAAAAVFFLSFLFRFPLEGGGMILRLGLTWTYLGFGLVMLLFLFAGKYRGQDVLSKGLAFLGVRSYSIYLWHLPAAFFVAAGIVRYVPFFHSPAWASVIYLISAVAIGSASYLWIERPVLAWRDRRFPSS